MSTSSTAKLTLRLLTETFAIHSLSVNSDIPESVFKAPIYFIGKTYGEVSIVLPENIEINSEDVEKNWRALEVIGPLDFTLTGILSNISTSLANAQISIFAISTFDTDYILIKNDNVDNAIAALKADQYRVLRKNVQHS